jgi:integrative and conjugative element protein (TIGR02256 family)
VKPPVLWWAQTALDQALAEADKAHPLETGGVLLGWRHSPTETVVTGLVGPGPDAEHHPTWFRPDTNWQQAQIDKAYADSGRTVAYLGDWHTHPDGTAALSPKDRRTLRRIARHTDARIPQPIMAVLAGGPEWRLTVRQLTRPRGWRTQTVATTPY